MPVVPVLAAIGGGSAVAGGVGLATTAAGLISSNQQKKAAQGAAAAAANQAPATVDIAELQKQAQSIAQENAANSAALEARYNPGAAQLRQQSLSGLTQSLQPNLQVNAIANQIAAQAGAMPTGISYDSPLLREAIAKATADLQLGGQLPQDVRNLVMRQALAKSGSVSGGLNLGRDIGVRDLGLTSLQLEQQRLAQAAALGQQEAALGQGNANLSLQAQLAGQNNLFNSGSFLQSVANGDFSKQLAAAQLGQNIAQPMSGLDPGSITNLAVGNSNAIANQTQQANAAKVAAANQNAQYNSNLLGAGLGLVGNIIKAPGLFGSSVSTPAVATPQGSYNVPFYAMK